MAGRETEKAPPDQRKQVFVAYSYRLYPKEDYRRVYRDLEKEYDVTFIFADEQITNMHIMKKIETYIRGSDFCVFDISGWNPNVTLELGFAMPVTDQWYVAIDPSKTDTHEVPSDLRGIDRIQYASYKELGDRLRILIEQRYPKRKNVGLDSFLAERQKEALELLRKSPGLTITDLADFLGVQVAVAQLVVKPLVGTMLRTTGVKKGMKYFLIDEALKASTAGTNEFF